MRKQFFIYCLVAIAALFVSCQDENLPDSQPGLGGSEEFMTVYANIKLAMPGAGMNSRAANTNDEEFENGTEGENEVANLMILFYGEDKGLPVGIYSNGEADWSYNGDGDTAVPPADDIEGDIEWNDAQVVPIKMLRPGNPFYAVAYLNYDAAWDLESKTMADAHSEVKSVYKVNLTPKNGGEAKDFFFMSNSGYFDSADDDSYAYETKIKDFVFTTKEEAKSSRAISIYVERAAVRVDLKIDSEGIETSTVIYGDEEKELTFAPQYWALTATEKENYLVKHMQAALSSYEGTDYPDDFSDWISYANHRTFWAETPKYSTYEYPESGQTIPSGANYLNYVQLDNSKVASETDMKSLGWHKLSLSNSSYEGKDYTFEHTFKHTDLLSAANPYAVPSSVVIFGQYTCSDLDFNNAGFYIRDLGGEKHIYLENNEDGEDDLLNALLAEQTVIVTKDEVADSEPTYTPVADETLFEVANTHRFYFADENEAESSNAWTLQLDETAISGKELYLKKYVAAADNTPAHYEYLKIGEGETTVAVANAALQKNVGSAFKYTDTQAYYYVPVLHYIDQHDSYKTEDSAYAYTGDFAYDEDGEIENLTGEFGLVRNHIYKLTINTITGLGYGQGGEDITPLPDPKEEKQYWMHARLQVLSWHVIEFNVDLKK